MAVLVQKFQATIEEEGLWGAMRWLNGRVPYRFTAIFAFYGETLRNICLVDKEDAAVTGCPDQPITESYCIYIHRSGEPFCLDEALLDQRVTGHPKQHSYQCYYGIPLLGADGKLLGTVCHFDRAPVPVTADVVTVMDDLAPFIAEAVFTEGRSVDAGLEF